MGTAVLGPRMWNNEPAVLTPTSMNGQCLLPLLVPAWCAGRSWDLGFWHDKPAVIASVSTCALVWMTPLWSFVDDAAAQYPLLVIT